MGVVVGEKLVRIAERARDQQAPAHHRVRQRRRPHAGGHALPAADGQDLRRHAAPRDAGCPYISILAHPTTGGVFASFANLGDLILAEPGALIGFAGPRVAEQAIGQKLPEGSHTAEFLFAHGMIDAIVDRREQRDLLGTRARNPRRPSLRLPPA